MFRSIRIRIRKLRSKSSGPSGYLRFGLDNFFLDVCRVGFPGLPLQLSLDHQHLVIRAAQRIEKLELGLRTGTFRTGIRRLGGSLFRLCFVGEKPLDVEEGPTAEVGVRVEVVSRTKADLAERVFDDNLEKIDGRLTSVCSGGEVRGQPRLCLHKTSFFWVWRETNIEQIFEQ